MNQDEVVTTLVVRDEKFPVKLHVNRDNTASFRVDEWPDGEGHVFVQDETLKGVYDKLMRETKRAKVTVEVPFTTKNDLTPGVATGIHGGTGNITATVENKYGRAKGEQLSSYGSDAFKPLTATEVDHLKALRQKARDAQDEVDAYEKPRRLDLRKAVREAITAKTDEALAAEAKS